MNEAKTDVARASQYYAGASGKEYADWQLRVSADTGKIVARHFQSVIRPGDVVLDFGCGSGGVLAAVKCAVRIGVEPNETPRAVAASRGVTVFASLDGVADQSVDVAVSNHALEHALQPFLELTLIRKKLRASGKFVLVLPIDDWRGQRRYDKRDHNRHLFAWTPLTIGHLLDEAGFDVQSAVIIHTAWPPKAAFFFKILPRPIFDGLCRVCSLLTNSREMRIVAHVKSSVAKTS